MGRLETASAAVILTEPYRTPNHQSMRRWSFLLAFVAACATTEVSEGEDPKPHATKPPAQPKPPPQRAEPERPLPPAKPSPVEPAAKPTPPVERQVEAALKVVEEGRAIQRARGEGGADDAIAAYREALKLDPQCAAAYWELGWSYQVKDAWQEVVTAWDAVTAIDPNFPELAKHYPIAVMRRDQARSLATLPDPSRLPPPEETPRDGPTITIAAVGDVQLGRAWPAERAKLPPDDARPIFDAIAPALADADVTFGNLETVLADEGQSRKCGPRSTRCYAFRVPTRFAKTLKDVGFDVLSIANNHTGDFGEEGRTATMKALDAVGILHSGPVGDLASWQTNGLEVGLVAFSTGGGLYRVQDIDTAKRVVAELDRTHDLVIVSFHGGAEGTKAAHVPEGTEMFLGEDRGDLRAFTTGVIDSGADLVLGHGPHLLRGMRIYRGRLIAYSLGNFTSWETFNLSGPLGISGVLRVKLATNGVVLSASLLPVVIDKPGIPRTDDKGAAIGLVRKLSKADFGAEVLDASGSYAR